MDTFVEALVFLSNYLVYALFLLAAYQLGRLSMRWETEESRPFPGSRNP